MINSLKDNLMRVKAAIAETAIRCGRDPDEIRLVAVSKRFPESVIEELLSYNHFLFGENRAQEFRDKVKKLPEDIEWHFIGHLQKNKLKYVIPKAKLLHSVDSVDLAKNISDFAENKNTVVPVLLQVNASGEKSKFGFDPLQAEDRILQIAGTLKNIEVKGLMSMAPFTSDEKVIRDTFVKTRAIFNSINKKLDSNRLTILSMGMSNDFKLAIEEGSSMLRIGSSIFGERDK